MTWLERQVRNASLRQLGVCVLAIAAMIGMLAYNYRYLSNTFDGVYEMPRAELLAAANHEALPRYWVKLKVDRVFDTGHDIETVSRRSRRITGHHYVGVVGDRMLLIETHGEKLGTGAMVLEGGLIAPQDDFIARLSEANSQIPRLKERFLPMRLDTQRFGSDAELMMGLAAIVSGLAVLWGLWATYRASAPKGHAALRPLVKTPGALDAASRQIEADIGARRIAKLGDGVQLTSTHLVHSSALGFKVKPLADLLWAYPVVITKKMYGFIPTGKSYAATLAFADAETSYKGREPQTLEVMRHLSLVAPWVLIGHSADLETAYKKQRRELAGFVAGRRQQVLAQQSQPPTAGPSGAAPAA